MEPKHTCASICDQLPTLSANHPWLVDHNLGDNSRGHIIYTMRDPPSQFRCLIPPFLGRRVWGCFHGWVILSNHPRNDMWSLWNPVNSKIICLPRLVPKNGDRGLYITRQFCLSSPPDDHGSIFMLTAEENTIIFCRLDYKRNSLKWVEMSYAKQMRSITDYDGSLCSLTCCDGKVYALFSGPSKTVVIHIDIVVKGTEIVISLLSYMAAPSYYLDGCSTSIPFMQGCCTELFYVKLGLNEVGHVTKKTVGGVCAFKLDMKKKRWEKLEDLKDAAFFLDPAHGYTMFYSPKVASDVGGYLHYLHGSGKVIHSYDFKNKTIAFSPMPTRNASMLERMRLQGDHGEIKSQQKEHKEYEVVVRDDEVDGNSTSIEENIESRLLNIPFDILKTIMEICVGIEYLNFRSICKQCHLAAPMIRWSKGGRLQTYSLASPWLMVLDKDRGIISFTDPMFGDKYFLKTPTEFIGEVEIHCSMYGWLLIRKHSEPLMFFNPFTSEIRELPYVPFLDSYCFSAPPTSPDCMVVGFTTRSEWNVYIHFVAQESSWRRFHINFCGDVSHSFHFATHYGRNLYALYNNGGLKFIDTQNQDYTLHEVPRTSYRSTKQNFLMRCDQHLLLVVTSEHGEFVEVFKFNDSTEWEKIESLGRHAIYICGNACLCIEAKMPEMANKIYFPRLHSVNMKIVFYSLETRRYHTSNIEESFVDFVGTKHHIEPHVWIEPSWS